MKNILILIIIIVIALVAWMILKPETTTAPGNTTAEEAAIDKDLSSLDVSGLEGDFETIDKDLQSL